MCPIFFIALSQWRQIYETAKLSLVTLSNLICSSSKDHLIGDSVIYNDQSPYSNLILSQSTHCSVADCFCVAGLCNIDIYG